MSVMRDENGIEVDEWGSFVLYCGICSNKIRKYNPDGEDWRHIEKKEPNENGDIEYMEICEKCSISDWDRLKASGWCDPSEDDPEESNNAEQA